MNCYITYDYELCLGSRTGTPEDCLIKPMESLCLMFDKYGVKANIFVDSAYLMRLAELKEKHSQLEYDYNAVTENIKLLSKRGHSIQFHFHPQWIKAEFVGGKWLLDNDHYKLSDYPLEVQIYYLSKSLDLLQSLSSNKICAFRAGGFSIENFKELAPFMLEKGIIIDTSVLRGGYVNSKYQKYDYRSIPLSSSYRFSDSNKNEDSNGGFIEFPISVMELDSFSYLYYKYIKRKRIEKQFSDYSTARWNDGVGIGSSVKPLTRLKQYIKRIVSSSPLYASADGALVYFLSDVFDYCLKKYKGEDFVIIGHPKIASPRTIAALELFISEHKSVMDFLTFR